MGGGNRNGRESYAKVRYADQIPKKETLFSFSGKPKVFISFHAGDEARVNFLRSQSKDGKLEFADYSIKEPFDEKWKTQCTERIKKCEALVVMIGPETYKREAVDWEIRKAQELGIPVIGVLIYRDKNHQIPQALKEMSAPVIYWNLEEIQKRIDKAKKQKED